MLAHPAKFISVFSSLVLLSACSTAQDTTRPVESDSGVEVFNLGQNPEVEKNVVRLPRLEMDQTVPEISSQLSSQKVSRASDLSASTSMGSRVEPLMNITPQQVFDSLAALPPAPIAVASDSSVQIFPLDGAVAPTPYQTAVPYQPMDAVHSGMTPMQPVPARADSSVLIFPIDGAPVMPMMPAPQIMAPAQYRPAPISPFTAESGLSMMETSNGKIIFFKHASARLGSLDKKRIKEVAATVKNDPFRKVQVTGHASKPTVAKTPVGEDITNLKMSMRRTEKVAAALIREGVPAEKIVSVALGDTVPNSSAHGVKGGKDAADRRVELSLQ